MQKKTILLVEDDDGVRDMIRGTLELKYSVLAACNCSEALEQINNDIDLALIDYSLPDGDGFDVLEKIKETKPNLPIIFMTAYSTDNLVIKAFRRGVTDYIKKPLRFAYLMGKLSEILEGKPNDEPPENIERHEVFVMDYIAAYIENNYYEALNRDILAETVHMERYRFSRTFNQRFGKNVKRYINNVRINKASDLLKDNPNLRITDVAVSAGFGDVAYFSRLFKDAFGMSPSRFRSDRKYFRSRA